MIFTLLHMKTELGREVTITILWSVQNYTNAQLTEEPEQRRARV
jgi:hypothetical protein